MNPALDSSEAKPNAYEQRKWTSSVQDSMGKIRDSKVMQIRSPRSMHVKGTVPTRSPKVINKDLPSDVEEEIVLPKERKISSQEKLVPLEKFDGIVPVDV